MNIIAQIADIFGLKRMPWIIQVYLVLLLVCVGLIVWSAGELPKPIDPNHPMVKFFEFASDSFKVVLGAVIGSLSMAAAAAWGTAHGGHQRPIGMDDLPERIEGPAGRVK